MLTIHVAGASEARALIGYIGDVIIIIIIIVVIIIIKLCITISAKRTGLPILIKQTGGRVMTSYRFFKMAATELEIYFRIWF